MGQSRLLLRRAAALLAVAVPGAVAVLGGGAGASAPRPFYSGAQVTYIAPGYRLTATDDWGRAVAPVLGGLLDAKVVVTNDFAAAPLGGQATLAASPPDGLTFGALEPAFDLPLQISGRAGLGFKPNDFDVLAVVGGGTDLVWCVAPGFRDQTVAALLKDPSRVKLAFDSVSGLDDMVVRSVDGVLGLKAQLIGGYASSDYAVYGFERGDAPLAVAPIGDFTALIEAGKAVPVMVSSSVPGPSGGTPFLHDVPTIEQVASGRHLSDTASEALTELERIIGPLSGAVVALPLGVPKPRVATLTKALTRAIASVDPGESAVTGAPADQLYHRAVNEEGVLRRYLRTT